MTDRSVKIPFVSLLLFFLVAAGCYGSFALTTKLYDFNGSVRDPVARSIVTVPLLGIYIMTGIGDAFLFNPIEFWSGKNPIEEEIEHPRPKGKRKSSLGEDLFVHTSHRTASGLEVRTDSYRQGSLVRSLTVHVPSASGGGHSPVVTADLRWAGTGAHESYTARALPDGGVIVARIGPTGERTTSLLRAEEVQKVIATKALPQ